MKVDANDVAREIGTGALRDLLDAPAQPNGGGLSETARPPDFTDEALALRFAAEHAKHLRYVAAWSKWLIWDGKRWQPDDTLRAFDHAREVCREESAQCDEKKFARAIASAPTVAAVVTLARADRRLAATIDQWDTGAWLLNTPAGVIDLQTGKCRPHRPNDYFTKLTGVAPDASCPTPTWLKFLDRITASNAEVINFLRRVAGYSLTGITREQALFFLYGGGANGKSTFLDALIAAAGDYHRTAPIETFTVATGERHPTDLAGLRGARLVTAVETEEGRQWAESKIKALTGGDKIAARFMRQDFFEFVPQFKLLIAGNHKPGLKSVDEAIRRRIYLVPFSITIPPAERDKNLSERLKAELSGILAWMIQGCLDWQQKGLAPPTAVTAATEAYLEAEDATAAWIVECCKCDGTAWERTAALFASWSTWADKTGEIAGSQRRFAERLEMRGFVLARRKDARGFAGLRLISNYEDPDHRYG